MRENLLANRKNCKGLLRAKGPRSTEGDGGRGDWGVDGCKTPKEGGTAKRRGEGVKPGLQNGVQGKTRVLFFKLAEFEELLKFRKSKKMATSKPQTWRKRTLHGKDRKK